MNRSRKILLGLAFGMCAIVAFWAYQTSGRTRMAVADLNKIQAQIAREEEHIEILRAEWAILNRPERLRYLVERNQAQLGLTQITADNYGEALDVPYVSETPNALDYIDPADIEAILRDLMDQGEIEIQ